LPARHFFFEFFGQPSGANTFLNTPPKSEKHRVLVAGQEKRRLTSAESGLQLYLAAGRGDLDAVKTQLQAGVAAFEQVFRCGGSGHIWG